MYFENLIVELYILIMLHACKTENAPIGSN